MSSNVPNLIPLLGISDSPSQENAASDHVVRQPAPRISVIIPALNEADNLPHVLQRIPPWLHEVVLVDGGSSDGTVEIARQSWPNKRIVLSERRNRYPAQELLLPERRSSGITLRIAIQTGRGKGGALRDGFRAATGDIIIMLDADGSNDPAEIPAFLGALFAGADFAKGSRFLQGGGTWDMPFYRKLGNWSFVCLVRILFGGNYSDLCYGYNAFWTRVLPQLELSADGFEIETMMNVRALRRGLKILEVPSFEYKRIYGSGRLKTIPDGWRVLKTIFIEAVRQSRHDVLRKPEIESPEFRGTLLGQ